MTTRIQFIEELARINHDILAMGTRVEEDIRKALMALRGMDVDLAREVKADDAVINAMQIKIEDQAAILIATQQPVAKDLRELVTMFKITDNLERSGDHAVHLAKAVIKLADDPYGRPLDALERMAESACAMVRDATNAFLNHDAVLARATAKRDDEIDAEHKAFVKSVLDFIRDHPEKAQLATKLIQTSGFLERLGDHVTNICEAVVFMVDGVHVELNE